MSLKRIEVVPDDEEDIIEAVRRMSSRYDFVVTSGGIGPTCVTPVPWFSPSREPILLITRAPP